MTYIIENLKVFFLLFPLLISVAPSSYAQGESDRLKNPYHSELWTRKLAGSNECAYALLDTINNHWERSSLKNTLSMALINPTASDNWNVSIVQLSMIEYLFLQSHSFSLFGALTYQNKLFVLQCIDSWDMKQTQNYFFQCQDSIKILPDYQTFISECNNYSFIVDTLHSDKNNVLDWEVFIYNRFINLKCGEDDKCFSCKEIPNKQNNQH